MKATPILAGFLLCSLPALAQSIPNGTFDSDLSGWVLPNRPDTTVTWNAFGLPAGSMLIESNWTPPGPGVGGIVSMTSDCFDLAAGSYTVTADFFAEIATNNGDECHLDYTIYTSPGCETGNLGGSTVGWNVSGSWQHLELTFDVFEPVTTSWRFNVSMLKYAGQVPSRCYFDNVRLVGPPVQTVEVPTLNGTALFAYGGVLAVAALMALRRRVRAGR